MYSSFTVAVRSDVVASSWAHEQNPMVYDLLCDLLCRRVRCTGADLVGRSARFWDRICVVGAVTMQASRSFVFIVYLFIIGFQFADVMNFASMPCLPNRYAFPAIIIYGRFSELIIGRRGSKRISTGWLVLIF